MKTAYLSITSFLLISMFYACNNSKKSTTSTDTTAVATETVPPATVSRITDKKWKLVELAGQPVVDSINGKEPFIMLNKADSNYEANGGCNGLGGKFTLDEKTLRIHFTQGMSTMMACPDMTIEEGLKKVFEATDNYSTNDSTLSFNKARMAPLARFRAVE